ncbi:MAG: hypothetical protein IT359_02755 [Gemmatimonadaceae bacterium]|nr:hypothetical protein [Gemmatimonadaceae bacterium]
MSDRPPAATASRNQGSFRCDVVRATDPAVLPAERALDAASFPLPLPSRQAWARHLGTPADHVAIARDETGAVRSLLGISLTATRALPLHRVARVEGVGSGYAGADGRALLLAVSDFARQHPRILRVVVEVETSDDAARRTISGFLHEAGYRRIPSERVSERTLSIDLRPTEEEMFAALSRRGRQNIRLAAKQGLETVALGEPRDERYGSRMNALLVDALARTGAAPQDKDWGAIFALCRDRPERSRVAAVFRGAGREPDDLVGYAWGMHHGDRVEYSTGASARIPGVSLPILYPAIWDIVLWGKRTGGTWFDLGGVTPGEPGSGDALGGISHFKRGFSKDEVSLGEEWALAPHPLRARIADWTSAMARRVRERRQARHQGVAASTPELPAHEPSPSADA